MQSEKHNGAHSAEQAEDLTNAAEACGINVGKMTLKDLRVFAAALMEENTQLEQQSNLLKEENAKLTKLAEKASQLSNMYSSLSKDFDAFRTRNKEIERASLDNATVETALKIVPVYENLKRALDCVPEGAQREGVELIHRQFSEVLESLGIVRIAAEEEMFDPYRHNAVMAVDTDDEGLKGRIKQVYSDGYAFKDKVVKQSQVIVYR